MNINSHFQRQDILNMQMYFTVSHMISTEHAQYVYNVLKSRMLDENIAGLFKTTHSCGSHHYIIVR